MGRPFVALEDSANLLLSLLSFPADKWGAAKVNAARKNSAANPVIVFFRRQKDSILQNGFLFMFPAPFAGIRAVSAKEGAGFRCRTRMLTRDSGKSCGLTRPLALKVRRFFVFTEAPRCSRSQPHSRALFQVSPTCGASGKGCRSRAERKAFKLQTSCASSCRRTK